MCLNIFKYKWWWIMITMLRSPCSQSTKHDFIHNNQNITVVLNIFCCWPHPEQNRWGILKIWNLDFRSVWKETKHSFTTDKRINFVLLLLIFQIQRKICFFFYVNLFYWWNFSFEFVWYLCDILQKLENWRGLWQGKPNCQISGSGNYKIKKS